jgi:predicted DCC family thiol-disulfide oxidoreductase YuxK
MTDPAATARPTVYYDGACPVCSREIAAYRRQPGADAMQWVDAASCDASAFGPGLQRGDALARMHVRRADGQLVSGAAAFVEIWAGLPRTARWARWLGHAAVLPVLERGYRAFLVLRKGWRR